MSRLLSLLALVVLYAPALFAQSPKSEVYQLTVYHYRTSAQESALDAYLQQALLPALHRKGAGTIGVFKPIANDTAAVKRVYLVIPFRNWSRALNWRSELVSDNVYMQAAKSFEEAPHSNPPYDRMENMLMRAFKLAPSMKIPRLTAPLADRVYELRSYEGPTEERYRNKVHMFNEGGEIALFDRLGFNAVFYADVVAGGRMPNLVYMTSFNSMDDRNAHWKAFGEAPEWKKLISMKEYEHNVSKADIILMRATPYSGY